MKSGVIPGRVAAAGATLALHGVIIGIAIALAGSPIAHQHSKPVEVVLIRPPEALPVQPRPAVKPPEPRPVAKTPSKPAPKSPSPQPAAPVPAQPVVVARPVEDARPASITAAAAPADTPVAPKVTEGAPAVIAAPRDPAPVAAAPTRIGPRIDASWSGNTPPPYPVMARRMGEEGEVRLDVHVGPDGGVLEVRLKKSSGSRLLDQTTIETVKKWRFSPATIDGRPVAEWYRDWKWIFKLES